MAKKRRTGRPTKYSANLVSRLPDCFQDGQSIAEVCTHLRISRQTYYTWLEEHPEFKEAHEEGLFRSEAWWMRLGRMGASGAVPINASVWSFNMKNRFHWRDRPEMDKEDELSPEEYARRAHLALIEMNAADKGKSLPDSGIQSVGNG